MQISTQEVMSPRIIEKVYQSGIIPTIIIDNASHAAALAEALIKGGIDTIELTLRTKAALAAAKIIKKEVPEIVLGFGTVLTKDQVKSVVDVGADFAVSPGCNPKIIEEAIKQKLSFAPGIMTPSDIEIAVELGCRVLKYFPAESAGGMAHLKNMAAPYNYLGLSFIPLGGLNLNNVNSYLESPLIPAVGGSWIASRNLIQSENWKQITENSKEIKSLIKQIRL